VERVRANQGSRPLAHLLRISDPAAIPEAHPQRQSGSQVHWPRIQGSHQIPSSGFRERAHPQVW